MTGRRVRDALLAQRMLATRNRLDARWRLLLEAAAPDLVATRSPAEAEQILQRIVDDLVGILDEEETATLELLTSTPLRIH